ncbi:MAG: hypothetical protein AAB909_00480 [Patescibacteria group bacterium]
MKARVETELNATDQSALEAFRLNARAALTEVAEFYYDVATAFPPTLFPSTVEAYDLAVLADRLSRLATESTQQPKPIS